MPIDLRLSDANCSAKKPPPAIGPTTCTRNLACTSSQVQEFRAKRSVRRPAKKVIVVSLRKPNICHSEERNEEESCRE